jgi:hypothetical protein
MRTAGQKRASARWKAQHPARWKAIQNRSKRRAYGRKHGLKESARLRDVIAATHHADADHPGWTCVLSCGHVVHLLPQRVGTRAPPPQRKKCWVCIQDETP